MMNEVKIVTARLNNNKELVPMSIFLYVAMHFGNRLWNGYDEAFWSEIFTHDDAVSLSSYLISTSFSGGIVVVYSIVFLPSSGMLRMRSAFAPSQVASKFELPN